MKLSSELVTTTELEITNGLEEILENVTTNEADAIGITAENYPRIDGATSTLPLVQNIYMSMFLPNDEREWTKLPQQASKTMQAYEMLIAGDVDLILVPDPSQDIEDKVKEAGIELEYIPIGAEALVFITHEDNPVGNITKEQMQEIYSLMTIDNWSQLDGINGRIVPICRNADAGSQAQMENMVMDGKPMALKIEENFMERDMSGMLDMVGEYKFFAYEGEENAYNIGYSMYYCIKIVGSVAGELFINPLDLKV